MLSYADAVELIQQQLPPPAVVRLPLSMSSLKVLAEDVVADSDIPPFDKALMDGYAVRSQDVRKAPVQLHAIGISSAGRPLACKLAPGQCVQIMTGAVVPAGADAVQRVEKTGRINDSTVEILEAVSEGENILKQAGEVRRGQVVLRKGTVLTAVPIGVLAAFGYTHVSCYAAPRASIVSTGDEIVEITERPETGKIRNSNAYMLHAQCRSLALEVDLLPIVVDDPGELKKALSRALLNELVLFTGGVSMGEFDYLPRVLKESGADIILHKVAIKPGKPILVGRKDRSLIFGLPGNPVSSFVTFELFVRPAVRKWMGFAGSGLPKIWGNLLRDVRQTPGRIFFKAALTAYTNEQFQVDPLDTQGSSDLTGFAAANSLLVVGADVSFLPAGSRVEVLLLDRYFAAGDSPPSLECV